MITDQKDGVSCSGKQLVLGNQINGNNLLVQMWLAIDDEARCVWFGMVCLGGSNGSEAQAKPSCVGGVMIDQD